MTPKRILNSNVITVLTISATSHFCVQLLFHPERHFHDCIPLLLQKRCGRFVPKRIFSSAYVHRRRLSNQSILPLTRGVPKQRRYRFALMDQSTWERWIEPTESREKSVYPITRKGSGLAEGKGEMSALRTASSDLLSF